MNHLSFITPKLLIVIAASTSVGCAVLEGSDKDTEGEAGTTEETEPPDDADTETETETNPECACWSGDCCDGCHFDHPEQICDDEPFNIQYSCDSEQCGAVAIVRHQYRYCSGEHAACGEDNVKWHEWHVVEGCNEDQVCNWNADNAWCEIGDCGDAGSN